MTTSRLRNLLDKQVHYPFDNDLKVAQIKGNNNNMLFGSHPNTVEITQYATELRHLRELLIEKEKVIKDKEQLISILISKI